MKKCFTLFVLLLMTIGAFAQVEGSSAYFGMTMPRKTRSAGLSLGYKYQYNLSIVEGLGLVGSADLTFTRWNKEVRDNLTSSYNNWLEVLGYDEGDVKTKFRRSTEFYIPLNVGANYTYQFGRISAWGEFGMGIGTLFTTRSVMKGSESFSVKHEGTNSMGRPTVSYTSGTKHSYIVTRYNPAVGFSWKLALGAALDSKYSFGLYIDGMSKHNQTNIVSEDVKPYWNSGKDSYKRETKSKAKMKGFTQVALRVGYYF